MKKYFLLHDDNALVLINTYTNIKIPIKKNIVTISKMVIVLWF